MIERVSGLIDWLKNERIILSQAEFAEIIGIKASQISEMLTGKRAISERTINKIVDKFPEINRIWLLTGEGDMLVGENVQKVGNVSNNRGVIGHGNTVSGNVNITLPDKGYQKIIRADGTQTTVEVAMPYGDADPRDLAAENIALRKENSDLKDKIICLQGRLLEGK